MSAESQAVGDERVKAIDHANASHVIGFIREPFNEQAFREAFAEHLAALAVKHSVDGYTVLYLMDAEDDISSWHSNRIYQAASAAQKRDDILLVVHSPGGSIEPAYLISKTCGRLAKERFVVSVPRKAKSAATLLSLGADEIHMGLMSELGPIDPQIGGFPALGIKNALDVLSELSCKHPGAAQMLGEYIQSKLDLHILGYFERINESAMQYAERLLAGKAFPDGKTAQSLADHFVNYYKDHGFVIDLDEAAEMLGSEIVREGTPEYAFANAVYESYELIRLLLEHVVGRDVDIVGDRVGGPRVFERKKA